jgi:hypothetical protein
MRIRDEESRVGKPMMQTHVGFPHRKPKAYVQFVQLSKMRERIGFLSSFISIATVGILSKH